MLSVRRLCLVIIRYRGEIASFSCVSGPRLSFAECHSSSHCVFIVDDVGSSGATLEAVARILRERGITEIGAVVVHALFDADTPERLRESGIESLISTNSIIHASNAISLASLLAAEIERRSTPDEVA